MFALWLFPKPSVSTTLYTADLTPYVKNSWRHTTRALGGYWTGEFTITDAQMSRQKIWEFYHNHLGRRVMEDSFGQVTWEGEIYEMTVTVDGVSYMTTLDPERWHNKVKVQYTYPRIEDVNQGAMAYDPDAGNSFQDQGQDFSDWAVGAGVDAEYMITVTNDDATTCTGYLGTVFTTAVLNDSVHVYTDVERDDSNWIGDESGKTPVSYIISDIDLAGASQETAWSETTASSDIFGESCYIDVRGEMPAAAATAVRDRRLAECAYPKSVSVGGLSSDASQDRHEMALEVVCAGYVYSMNRRYMEADVEPGNISDQVTLLVDGSADAAEFVTAGNIDSNTTLQPSIAGGNMARRLWDMCEELAEMGDASGNRWVAGVYDGRKLNYKAAETAVTHYWRNGRLCNEAGHPIFPTLIRPDTIVRVDDVLFGVTGGGTAAWQNMRQFYVEEVEFIAPRSYRLVPFEGEALFGTY